MYALVRGMFLFIVVWYCRS